MQSGSRVHALNQHAILPDKKPQITRANMVLCPRRCQELKPFFFVTPLHVTCLAHCSASIERPPVVGKTFTCLGSTGSSCGHVCEQWQWFCPEPSYGFHFCLKHSHTEGGLGWLARALHPLLHCWEPGPGQRSGGTRAQRSSHQVEGESFWGVFVVVRVETPGYLSQGNGHIKWGGTCGAVKYSACSYTLGLRDETEQRGQEILSWVSEPRTI